MRISITVYDNNDKRIFGLKRVELQKGMGQLSGFVHEKMGVPLKVVSVKAKANVKASANKCFVCKKPIKKGFGMAYEGKEIHQACLMEARMQL
jgi:hypothetical protein